MAELAVTEVAVVDVAVVDDVAGSEVDDLSLDEARALIGQLYAARSAATKRRPGRRRPGRHLSDQSGAGVVDPPIDLSAHQHQGRGLGPGGRRVGGGLASHRSRRAFDGGLLLAAEARVRSGPPAPDRWPPEPFHGCVAFRTKIMKPASRRVDGNSSALLGGGQVLTARPWKQTRRPSQAYVVSQWVYPQLAAIADSLRSGKENVMTLTSEELSRVADGNVVNANGDKLGGIGQIYVDDETGEPELGHGQDRALRHLGVVRAACPARQYQALTSSSTTTRTRSRTHLGSTPMGT